MKWVLLEVLLLFFFLTLNSGDARREWRVRSAESEIKKITEELLLIDATIDYVELTPEMKRHFERKRRLLNIQKDELNKRHYESSYKRNSDKR